MYLHCDLFVCVCVFVFFVFLFCKRQNDLIDVINIKKNNTFQLNLERKKNKQNFKRNSRLHWKLSGTTFMRKDIQNGVIRLANCGAGIYQSAEEMTIVEFVWKVRYEF